ncbi:MAG: O-succinylhomoserine sulfhydrylase [Candidatus Polarisedimenticolaceae bacterium]|nr:O-succinylhomoserine sulfhydrylase [Candidatus Polarisedimenticolaceae bacterium]
MFDDPSDLALATLAVRTGHRRTHEGEHSEAIFATSSYVFESAADAAAIFAGDKPGNIYSRFTNPTVRTFEERLAALEGGECCVATASGMAAILATCIALLKSGDHILASQSLFGSTTVLFNKYLTKFGIKISYLPGSDEQAWQQGVKPNTRILFIETPSNPQVEVIDIAAMADLAHAHDAVLVVDNCFCTPVLQRPLDLGADIVIHSATKYLDGQGRCIGGAVVGDKKLVGEEVLGVIRTAGPSMSPFNAWVFLKGLETLDLRMKAHSSSAHTLAIWLESHPAIERVYYPSLKSHPQHALAMRQQKAGGGIVTFDVKGGQPAAWSVMDATQILSITANLGDTKSTITHPASTTHGRLTPEERSQANISDGMLRISVGLEDIEDIKRDLSRGLDRL